MTTSWSQNDLNQALSAIKNGIPVQKAAAQYKIPTGTLYGRCKKGGIELSKTSNVLWSEEDMNKALESVKTGGMSINQVKPALTFTHFIFLNYAHFLLTRQYVYSKK